MLQITDLQAKFDAAKRKPSTLSQQNLLKFNAIKNTLKLNLSAS